MKRIVTNISVIFTKTFAVSLFQLVHYLASSKLVTETIVYNVWGEKCSSTFREKKKKIKTRLFDWKRTQVLKLKYIYSSTLLSI